MVTETANQSGTMPFSLCSRCKTSPGTVPGRNDDVICKNCFLTYVRSKPIKRMDPFRVRHSSANSPPPKLLLPFSFGASSVSLLHILHGQMASQKERVQRTGYELVVVWVDESAVLGADEGRISRKEEAFREAEKRYGGSGVDFMIKKIEDIYSVKSAVSEVLGESGVAEPAEANGFAEDDNRGRLQRLILSLLALTSRADILYQLRSRLLIHLAETLSCTAILYSQSTTALAQLVLSETVKGRGYSMPWQISDGMMPYLAKTSTGSNGVRIFFPLRDILRKELLRFVELTEGLPEIEVDVKGPTVGPAVAVNAKTTTIDDLMRGYFENMEDAYPSIVANVVKTASRLVPPSVEEGGGGWCKVCGLPKDVAVDLDMVYAEAEGPKGGGQREMCSGCARNMEGARGQVWPL